MKQKIKKTTKKLTTKSRAFAIGSHSGILMASVPYTQNDFKNSLLIVSVVVNTFLLTAWVSTLVSAEYAYTIAQAIVQ